MSRTRSLGLALLPAVLCAVAEAQTPVQLIGLVDRTPAPLVQQDPQTCVTSSCSTLLTSVAQPFLGGTAYDTTRAAAWVSNGPILEAVDPRTCVRVCPPQPLPPGIVGQVTGLAINEAQGVMVVVDTANVIYQYKLDCPVQDLVSRCQVTLPLGFQIGGIATDDVNDLVIYTASSFGGAVLGSQLFIAPRANPCNPICQVPVPDCGGQPMRSITGVAYQACRQTIWLTDGNRTLGLRRLAASPCAFQEVQCCPMNVANGYVGLCVRPSEATSTGGNCQNLGCPACPGMQHVVNGSPAIGNPAFSLDLVLAPGNSLAALFFGLGPCNPIGPVVAPFCGPILVPLAPPPVAFNFPNGGAPGSCQTLQVPAPLPNDPALCGATLSTQFVGVCSSGPIIGTYVSNCQTWTIDG